MTCWCVDCRKVSTGLQAVKVFDSEREALEYAAAMRAVGFEVASWKL